MGIYIPDWTQFTNLTPAPLFEIKRGVRTGNLVYGLENTNQIGKIHFEASPPLFIKTKIPIPFSKQSKIHISFSSWRRCPKGG